MTARHVLVVGIGSPHGNDRVGWQVVDALVASLPDGLDARQVTSPTELLTIGLVYDRWVLVDAVRGAEPVGTLYRWEWPELPATYDLYSGTHDLGLRESLQIADTLGILPPHVTLVGIQIEPEGKDVPCIEPKWSPSLGASVDKAIRMILSEYVHPFTIN